MEVILVNKSPKLYYTYPLHEHGYWEILYNLQGEGTASIDGQEYAFKRGTILYIPPETLHRKTATDGFIDASVFIKDFPTVNGVEVGYFEDDGNQTFCNLLQLAFDIQLKNELNSKETINALGDVMYQLMVGWNATSYKKNPLVESIQSIMLENISNCSFDLHSEIQRTGYCSSYFRKLFKDHTGYSPTNYLSYLRIEYSKKQIQQYHKVRTIKEIAMQSGFPDPYYFSRVFKKHEGIGPKQYIDNLGSFDQLLLTGIHYSD